MMYEAPDSELQNVLGRITLADLMGTPALQNLCIRFLCSIRRALLDVPPKDIELYAQLLALIMLANEMIPKERREQAFDSGRAQAPRSPYPTARP